MFNHITLTLAALALLSACSVKDDRTTVLTGSFYSPNASTSGLQVNNSYLPTRTIPF